MPVEDNELVINVRGGDNWFITENDRNIYLYLEEDDEVESELATFKLFETGEAVEGAYIGTVLHRNAGTVLHLYWENVYSIGKYREGVLYQEHSDGMMNERRQLRKSDDVSEVPASGGSFAREGASGQGEDVQHYLPE